MAPTVPAVRLILIFSLLGASACAQKKQSIRFPFKASLGMSRQQVAKAEGKPRGPQQENALTYSGRRFLGVKGQTRYIFIQDKAAALEFSAPYTEELAARAQQTFAAAFGAPADKETIEKAAAETLQERLRLAQALPPNQAEEAKEAARKDYSRALQLYALGARRWRAPDFLISLTVTADNSISIRFFK